MLRAARGRHQAIRLADEGDHDGARALLKHAATELRSFASAFPPEQAAAFEAEAQELEERETFLASASYDATARKTLRYKANLLHRRRR